MASFCTMLPRRYRMTLNWWFKGEQLFKVKPRCVYSGPFFISFLRTVFFCPAPFQSIFWKDFVCLPYKSICLIFAILTRCCVVSILSSMQAMEHDTTICYFFCKPEKFFTSVPPWFKTLKRFPNCIAIVVHFASEAICKALKYYVMILSEQKQSLSPKTTNLLLVRSMQRDGRDREWNDCTILYVTTVMNYWLKIKLQ